MRVHETIEPWLARDERKRAHYLDDPYFWEGRTYFRAACAGRYPETALRSLTFLLVKPEAIVGRRIAPIIEFVHERGYRVAGTWPVRMGRHEARSLWRYQLNTVPIAHLRALEMVVSAGELFLVGLVRRPGSAEASAAESLSRSKGSSDDPIGRGGGSLRDLLGRPAVMLNFVHAPDEPADVLRELAVLCDPARLAQAIGTLLAASHWSPAQFAAAAQTARVIMTSRYARSAAHDLDAAATLPRLRAWLRQHPAAGLAPRARAAIEAGQTSPEQALGVVESLAGVPELPAWDRIVTAVHLVDGLRTGRPPLIGAPPLRPPDEGEQRERL
ncbi:MAG TPA: hypothetical protein VNF47_24015 [Streptosporangiaceae bacterium]|nr:hypothetical protein [Streptosporangiaceae bacterium]